MSWITQSLGIVTSNVTLPGWIVLAGAVLGAIFVFLLLVRSEPNENPLTLLVLIGILLGGMGVGTALLREVQRTRTYSEARELEQRASTLDQATASAGLGCVNADDPLKAACEVTLFERPENVAAARGLVRARFALVEDAFNYVRQQRAGYLLERVAIWRRPLERDPYGIVASVLLERRSCTVSSCPALAVLGEIDRITANMTDDHYAKLVARYAPMWERSARNRGALTQPARTGPFGFAIVDHNQQQAPAGAEEPPPVVNLPVENAGPPAAEPGGAATGPAPLPPTRPPVSAAPPAQPRQTTRPAPPRNAPVPRAQTPPAAGEPASPFEPPPAPAEPAPAQ